MNTKICSKCGRELPLTEFNKNKTAKDGLQHWCKECQRQHDAKYRVEHANEKAAYLKQWYTEHADYFKQWYADNPDYFKQYHAEWYATLEGYAYHIRYANLIADRKANRCSKDEDPLPSIDYYIWALQQPDFYDGKQYHWSEMGLDRIYNDKAHTFANVVPCSTKNNRRRSRKSFEEFRALMQREREELELV